MLFRSSSAISPPASEVSITRPTRPPLASRMAAGVAAQSADRRTPMPRADHEAACRRASSRLGSPLPRSRKAVPPPRQASATSRGLGDNSPHGLTARTSSEFFTLPCLGYILRFHLLSQKHGIVDVRQKPYHDDALVREALDTQHLIRTALGTRITLADNGIGELMTHARARRSVFERLI